MPNPNYLRGRRWEYEVRKKWSQGQYKALRSAGSHSAFDVVAYQEVDENGPEGAEVYLQTREVRRGYEYLTYLTPIKGYGIQCKVKKLRGKR